MVEGFLWAGNPEPSGGGGEEERRVAVSEQLYTPGTLCIELMSLAGGGRFFIASIPRKAWSLEQGDISRAPPPCRPQPFQQQVSTGVHLNNSCVCVFVTFLICSMGAICPQNLLRDTRFSVEVCLWRHFLGTYHTPLYLYISNRNLYFFFIFFNIQPNISRQRVSFPHRDREIDGFGQRENWVQKAVLPHAISVAFLWPSWKGSCWNSRGASVAFRLPCHPPLISIPPN